jgi:hypothetical protein
MRILANQKSTTPPFSEHVDYIEDILPGVISKFFKKIGFSGFLGGLTLFIFSIRYNAVVTVGHRSSMSFALLNKIFGDKQTQVVKEFFIDENSFNSRTKTIIFRIVFKNVRLIITNSSGEILYLKKWLKIPENRFKFIAWPSNVQIKKYAVIYKAQVA